MLIKHTCKIKRLFIFHRFWSQLRNHTPETFSAKELFALVSDIAVQPLCSARLVPLITARCHSPLFPGWQLPRAVSSTHLTWPLTFSQTRSGLALGQRQIVHVLRG